MLGKKHPLVDQRARRQRTDVEIRDRCAADLCLDAAANDEQVALDLLDAFRVTGVEHDLFDLRSGGVRLFSDDGDVDGDLPPAIDVIAKTQDLGLDDRAAGFLSRVIGARQEYHSDANASRLQRVPGQTHLVSKKGLWHLDVDPGAVTRLAVCIDSAPVPNALEGVDRVEDDFPAGLAVDRRNQADAAGIALLVRMITVAFLEAQRVCGVACKFLRDLVGHAATPLRPARPALRFLTRRGLLRRRHDRP